MPPSDPVVSNVLCVVEGKGTSWIEAARRRCGGVSLEVLPLGSSPETYSASLPDGLPDGLSFVAGSRFAEASREEVQARYPAFWFEEIRRNGPDGRSILEMLRTPDGNLWWLCGSSEKSALRCSLVTDVYQMLLVREALRSKAYDEVWVDVRCASKRVTLQGLVGSEGVPCRSWGGGGGRPPRPWRFTTRLWARRLLLLAELLSSHALLSRLRPRGVPFRLAFYTTYPLNWFRAWGPDARDRIYGALPAQTQGREGAAFLAWVSLAPREIRRRRAQLLEAFQRANVLPLLAYTRVKDLLRVVSCRRLRALAQAYEDVTKRTKTLFSGIDVARLVEKELACGLGSAEVGVNEVVRAGARRFAEAEEPEYVVHWGEWQPVEKALAYGLRGTGTRAVAFQHSASSEMFLNYRFLPRELERDPEGGRDPDAMPLPDLFASTGHFAVESAIAAGFRPEMTRVCGAIRYPGLMKLVQWGGRDPARRKEMGLAGDGPVILFVTASKREDNQTMLRAFGAALARLDGAHAPVVIAKCHPFDPMEDLIRASLSESAPGIRVEVFGTDVPLDELLAVSDIMVGNSSASGLEALAAGVLPVFFHNPYVYDVSVLYSVADAVYIVADGRELSDALDSAMAGGDAVERRRRVARERLGYLVHDLDGGAEQRFFDFLRDAATADRG